MNSCGRPFPFLIRCAFFREDLSVEEKLKPLLGQVPGPCGSHPCVKLSVDGWDFTVFGCSSRRTGRPEVPTEDLH